MLAANSEEIAIPAWLEIIKSQLPGVISGSSIRFIASGAPCAIIRASTGDLETFRNLTRENTPGLISISTGEGEVRIQIQPTDESRETVNILIRAEETSLISIDRLTFQNEWTGSTEDLLDLKNHLIRFSGAEFTTENILKLCARSAMLDFEIEETTWENCLEKFDVAQMRLMSQDKIRKVVNSILLGARPSRGLIALSEIGALQEIMPELQAGKDLSQNRFHKHDVFLHSVYACDALKERNLPLRFAALLHDVGKSATRRPKENGEFSFHNHEVVGSRQADRILKRMGFDAGIISKVRFLIRNHMFHYTPEWTDHAVRRFMTKVSPEQMQDLITLRVADRKGSGKRAGIPRPIYDFLAHMDRLRAEDAELKIKDLKISGRELMDLGFKPGPAMGELLRELLEKVKSREIENDEAVLLALVREKLAGAAPVGT